MGGSGPRRGLAAASNSGGVTPLVHRGNVATVEAGALTAGDVAEAQTAFGIDLLHEVCQEGAERNVLVSPTSAAEALSLLFPASGGPTTEAFRAVLHLPDWSPDLVAAFREHTRALDGLRYDGDLDDDAPDALQMSNRLWTAVDREPDLRYLDHIATAFDAAVHALDFAADPSGATDRINTTIAEDTRGIIEKLFEQPLDTGTVAVLTNAVHLKARWATPFTDTRPAPFAAPAGPKSVDMMSGSTGIGRATDGWQSVELPYRDGTLAAVAVLPPEGTDPCTVDATVLSALENATAEQVDVHLPRLTIEQTHQLLEPLENLGLPLAGDYPALGGRLSISQVVQKTFLRVDEAGTEAAAATGVAVALSVRMPQPVVTFDRPFLVLLIDTRTRSPLFVAAVRDPSS